MSDYWGGKSDIIGTQATDWMSQLFGGGQKNIGASTDFFGKLLGGDKAAMMSAVAPEVSTLSAQNRAQVNNLSRFAPRGGGRTAAISSAPYALSAQIGSLLSGVRSNAANRMADIGISQLGLSNQQLSTLLQMLSATRQQDIEKRGQNMKLIGDITGSAAKMVDWTKVFGG